MAHGVPNLWPEDIAVTDLVPPSAILKGQATRLGDMTNQLLTGEVETEATNAYFVHSFYIVAPSLDRYRYQLFQVRHRIELYPCHGRFANREVELVDQQALINWLQETLSSEKSKRVIKALLAQVRT